MECGHLIAYILVYVSCKFETYIFKISLISIDENVRFAFLSVLSIGQYEYLSSEYYAFKSVIHVFKTLENDKNKVWWRCIVFLFGLYEHLRLNGFIGVTRILNKNLCGLNGVIRILNQEL